MRDCSLTAFVFWLTLSASPVVTNTDKHPSPTTNISRFKTDASQNYDANHLSSKNYGLGLVSQRTYQLPNNDTTRRKRMFVAEQTALHNFAKEWLKEIPLHLYTVASKISKRAAKNNHESAQLRVGKAVDIFARYGYLSLSFKVIPRNNYSDWIFREPTIDVFSDIGRYEIPLERVPWKQGRIFHGDFNMEFCDNVKQLLQAYFRDFSFERLDKPWKAFTASWSAETVAKYLGMNSTYVSGEGYRYVLLRLSRFHHGAQLSRSAIMEAPVADAITQEIGTMRVGSTAAVIDFTRKYGSHYINHYVTGNSLYQVFVFNKKRFQQIREQLKNQGISHTDNSTLHHFFSPWHAAHVGTIKVASGNKTVLAWASSVLRRSYYIFNYPCLLKIHDDTKLLSKLNNLLRNEAILEMNMKTLAPAFKDPHKRQWFEEVLDNISKLWEINL